MAQLYLKKTCRCKLNRVLEVHDSELLLAQYQAMQDDMASLRNQLKGILTQALQGEE
jgi:hypothetical protein